MTELREKMENFFPGDKDLAVEMLVEIKNVGKSIESLDLMLSKKLDLDDRKYMVKSLITSYAEISASIEIPIYYKFPELKKF
ncbi:hypothetical protein [Pseudocolwellia sp. HL-MZ7]|uniref:hypothetical protein n=1 Tax=Pseudocolwellia sp. HL-MZ7 TaxID=3400627 RepID=UPI003CF37892